MFTLPKMRVLVVDDDVSVADILAQLLDVLGMETMVVYDGVRAIIAASAWKPDLILMDIRMPIIDGYETARAIRDDTDTQSIPIYSLSGWMGQRENGEERKDVFDGRLTKPASMETIAYVLSKVAQRKAHLPGD